jgi:hypothetical protein
MTNFLKSITTYRMTDKSLNQDQYNILNQERAEFEKLINAGYTRNITPGWLQKMREIHNTLFGGFVNINCTTCIVDSMRRLWRKMQAFEEQQRQMMEHQARTATQEPAEPALIEPTQSSMTYGTDKPALESPQNSATIQSDETEKSVTSTPKAIHQGGNSRARGNNAKRWNPHRI